MHWRKCPHLFKHKKDYVTRAEKCKEEWEKSQREVAKLTKELDTLNGRLQDMELELQDRKGQIGHLQRDLRASQQRQSAVPPIREDHKENRPERGRATTANLPAQRAPPETHGYPGRDAKEEERYPEKPLVDIMKGDRVDDWVAAQAERTSRHNSKRSGQQPTKAHSLFGWEERRENRMKVAQSDRDFPITRGHQRQEHRQFHHQDATSAVDFRGWHSEGSISENSDMGKPPSEQGRVVRTEGQRQWDVSTILQYFKRTGKGPAIYDGASAKFEDWKGSVRRFLGKACGRKPGMSDSDWIDACSTYLEDKVSADVRQQMEMGNMWNKPYEEILEQMERIYDLESDPHQARQ